MNTGITKKLKLSTEREKALKAFQKARKLQDANDLGYVKCISCGAIIHVSEADGGHFIPRQFKATELEPSNVNAQCRKCNRFEAGNQIGYRKGLIEKYGEAEEKRLENLHDAARGSEEAYNSLPEEDKALIYSKRTAQYYHSEYLKWNKVCNQLAERERI